MGQAGPLGAARETLSRPVILALFLVCATQPYFLSLGSFLIGPYRLILMLVGPILAIQWLTGRFGRWLPPDFLILGYGLWMLVSLAANGQANRIAEWGASQFIDVYFAYLLGRAAIRTRQDFYFFTRILLWVLLFLMPFAVLESTMGMMILIRLSEALPMVQTFGIVTLDYPPRMGLMRAQTGAAHPILYGILCAMGFSFGLLGLAHAPGKPSFGKRLLMTAGCYVGTFFSLSSGAFLAAGIQGLLMLYHWILRNWRARWHVLGTGCALFYIFVSIVAERPPALVLGRLIAFSGSTAWNRYMIWQFGSAEVMRNPIFGMGNFIEWQRAPWMPLSVDNQWLLVAMRFGLVGLGMLLGAYAYILYRLMRMDFSHDREMSAIRYSFVFTLISLLIAYGTVASWNIQWSILLVLLGGSTWIFTTEPRSRSETAAADDPGNRGSIRYTRTRPEAPRKTADTAAGGAADATPRGAGRGPRYSRFMLRPRDGPPGR